MGWIETLSKVYDLNVGKAGLMPLFHMGLKVHVIVTLDENSSFVDARIISEKKDQYKIVPCTEESSTRTSGISPFPLCDSLQYIGGDLIIDHYLRQIENIKKRTKIKAKAQEANSLYLEQLGKWASWPKADPAIKNVFNYLNKKTICHDLIKKGILPVYSDGSIAVEYSTATKGKKLNRDEEVISLASIYNVVPDSLLKTMIAFEIEVRGKKRFLCDDQALQQNWQAYCLASNNSLIGLCQILGKETSIALIHPTRIRNPNDNAKLISSYDKFNFVYRGRFESPQEACSISVESSQKAHAALRWILSNRSYRDGSQYLAVWTNGDDMFVPSPVWDSVDLIRESNIIKSAQEQNVMDSLSNKEKEEKTIKETISYYLWKTEGDTICLILLDSANSGKLAIKNYREYSSHDYLNNLLKWHTTCTWFQIINKNKVFFGAPSIHDIARAAFGEMESEDFRFKMITCRLLPCITDNMAFPEDILKTVIRRTSHFESLEPWEFRRNLGIACSLYRYSNHKNKKISVTLDDNNKSRDYLYGRLLALASYLEYSTQSEVEKKHSTNALRLMARYAERPYSTWTLLCQVLVPYKTRLAFIRPRLFKRLESQTDFVLQSFENGDFFDNNILTGEYLFGYYCQNAALFRQNA